MTRSVRRPGPRLLAASVVTVAFALRLWQLGDVPFGFHPDEGHNAMDALAIADGWRPTFLPGNNGREPLFMYLSAIVLSIAGPSIWAARLMAAFAGTAFVAAEIAMAGRLGRASLGATGILAATLAATTFWPVAQNRYALRASLLPFWVALALWAWWRAVEPRTGPTVRGSAAWAALAGAFVAAAAYTHLIGRLLPLVFLVSAAWAARSTRRNSAFGALLVASSVAVGLLLPQLAYFARNPDMVAFRADQVSVWNAEVHQGDLPATLARNARRLAEAPFSRGDTSWYHNLRDRPVFDPVVAAFFALGMALAVRDLSGRAGPHRQGSAVLLLSALAVMAAPSLLSMGAPNYVRLTGTWPPLFALAAAGLAWTVAQAHRRRGRAPAAAVVIVVLAVGTAWTVRDYFVRYGSMPEVYDAFNGAAVERGTLLALLARDGPTYASPGLWRQSVIRFLAAASPPPGVFDPDDGLVLPGGDRVTYAFEPADAEAADRFARRWPWLERSALPDKRGSTALEVFGSDASTWRKELAWLFPRGDAVSGAAFGERIELAGARIERPDGGIRAGDTLTVTLAWRALGPVEPDHNRFVHVVGADDSVIAQADGPPVGGSFPTTAWRAGETIVEWIPVRAPTDAPSGEAEVRVGWYDWRTGERLPVEGDDDGAVVVATLWLGATGAP